MADEFGWSVGFFCTVSKWDQLPSKQRRQRQGLRHHCTAVTLVLDCGLWPGPTWSVLRLLRLLLHGLVLVVHNNDVVDPTRVRVSQQFDEFFESFSNQKWLITVILGKPRKFKRSGSYMNALRTAEEKPSDRLTASMQPKLPIPKKTPVEKGNSLR